MKSFRDYLGLSNSCSYDVDDVIGRADRFGFQNFCSPGREGALRHFWGKHVHLPSLEMVHINVMSLQRRSTS